MQEGDLIELEKTVEPTWPKLVEPLERIVDRLQVVWGIVNHLKAVKDSAELRTAIEEVQVESVNIWITSKDEYIVLLLMMFLLIFILD